MLIQPHVFLLRRIDKRGLFCYLFALMTLVTCPVSDSSFLR